MLSIHCLSVIKTLIFYVLKHILHDMGNLEARQLAVDYLIVIWISSCREILGKNMGNIT